MSKSIVLRPRLVIDAEAHPRLFAAIYSRAEHERAGFLTIAAEEGARVLLMRSCGGPGVAAQPTHELETPPPIDHSPTAAPASTPDPRPPAVHQEPNAYLKPGADLLGALAAFKQV